MLTDKVVHVLRSGANYHTDDNDNGSTNGNPSATDQIRHSTTEGSDGGKSNQIPNDHPNPSIETTNVGIDVRGDTTEEIKWNLRFSP